MRWIALLFQVLACTSGVLAQDSLYARRVINTLTSEKYHGRGYVKKGDIKAASYLENQFRRIGLSAPGGNYRQQFSFPVNTFPGRMELRIDGTRLMPGRDYIVHPGSPGIRGTFPLKKIDKPLLSYNTHELKNFWVIVDTSAAGGQVSAEDLKAWKENPLGAAGVIIIEHKKLTWSVSTKLRTSPAIIILRESMPPLPEKLTLDISSEFLLEHKAVNVIGYLPGTRYPDSLVCITAHYDHLGRMGDKTYFPGANDNSSGVSMLLNLAKWYAKPENRLPCSMLFICFAGEEAGLLGSSWYTQNPSFPLGNIRLLLNLDLMGTGDEGMMVVNATEFPGLFRTLDSINTEKNYLPKLGQRGKAANSDHYWFSEKGVPSFFFYTLGGISAYHDIYDRPETLPLTRYREVFHLIRDFLSVTAN